MHILIIEDDLEQAAELASRLESEGHSIDHAEDGDVALRKAAFVHSRNMARTRTFAHESRVSGARTLKDRVNLTGTRWRFIAENLALMSRYQLGDRKPFIVVNRASCRFRNPETGRTIRANSYASLAETAVEG